MTNVASYIKGGKWTVTICYWDNYMLLGQIYNWINSKQIKDLNTENETQNCHERICVNSFVLLRWRKPVFTMTCNPKATKEKVDNSNHMKMKNLCCQKHQSQSQMTNWEKLFALHITDNKLIFWVFKECPWIKKKKATTRKSRQNICYR